VDDLQALTIRFGAGRVGLQRPFEVVYDRQQLPDELDSGVL
jgi:hypothetical protein